MNITHCLHSIESIKFESAAIESRSEIIVTGEVLLLNLELTRSTWTIIHIGCMVHRIAYVQSVGWVLRIAFGCMELCFLLISRILGIGIYTFLFESLSYNFTFDEFLSSSKIVKSPHNLRIGGNRIFLKVEMFRPEIVLYPRGAVFLVGSIVQSALGCTSECIFSWLSHFIYNLNIILWDLEKK